MTEDERAAGLLISDLLVALREMVDMVLSPAYVDKADEARAMEVRYAIVSNACRVIAKAKGEGW